MTYDGIIQITSTLKFSLATVLLFQDLLAAYENLLSQTMAEPRECPESYRQLMCEKKCLQDAYNTLKHDMRKVLDEKQLLIEQVCVCMCVCLNIQNLNIHKLVSIP